MSHEELLRRITVDPAVCHGRPCLRGQRISVVLILGMLEGGMTHQQILANQPSLEEADILACLAFANERVRGRFVEVADEDAR